MTPACLRRHTAGMHAIRPASADDLDRVLDLLTREQQDPARACIFLGTQRDGILAELDDLETDWRATLRVAEREDGEIVGAVLSDWDRDLGRGWIHGPWVAGDWPRLAGELLDAALASAPPEVLSHELGADVAHTDLAALAAARGWSTSEISHVYVADRPTVEAWPPEDPRVRAPRPGDAAAIGPLHDREFPHTYYPLDRVLAGAASGDLLVGVADDGGFLGYAVGRVQADGEGYLDYLAVTDDARGRGVGEALLATVGRWIAAASPRGTLHLTVQDHRAPAVSLYERLGLRRECSMVGYGSPR